MAEVNDFKALLTDLIFVFIIIHSSVKHVPLAGINLPRYSNLPSEWLKRIRGVTP
jgi:23S rRNA maturation-related 3'-5' exoribonuclease YhaM